MRNAAMAVLLCLLLALPAHGSDKGHGLVVLLSNSYAPYRQALEGMERTLSAYDDPLPVIQADIAIRSHVAIAAMIRDARPRIIVTIGTEATLATLDMGMEIPLVFSMVLNPPRELMHRHGVTGVLLDIPADVQLSWIRKVCPDASRIGIIHTGSTVNCVERIRERSRRYGLETVPLLINDISTLPEILESLESRVDVLLAVPDGSIYNTIIAPQIILFCLQHRIPFIGLSGNFTRAGALFALDCDYTSIGEQTGVMVRKILAGRKPSEIPPAYARKLIPSFNMRTARILGIKIPQDLLEGARIFAD